MNISALKVRTRLGLGFALVLVLLVAITGLGISRMAQIEAHLERIVSVTILIRPDRPNIALPHHHY